VLLALGLLACGPAIGSRIDDGVLTTRVRTALLYDNALAVRRIEVTTADGVVTLSGVVGSHEEAERAERLARAVAGVRAVKSQLTIGSTDVGVPTSAQRPTPGPRPYIPIA